MAIDMSESYMRSLRFPNLAHLHIVILFRRFIKGFRRLAVYFERPSARSVPSVYRIFSQDIANMHEMYASKKYAYTESFFDDEFYKRLCAEWPARKYFEPPKEIIKSYDVGLLWLRGNDDPEYLRYFPYLQQLYSYLRSDAFGDTVTKLVGSKEPLRCRTVLLNRTYPGSLVIAHKDSPLPKEAGMYVNIIMFIRGTAGEGGGALVLSKDNEYREIIFDPPTLNNSVLVYDTDAPFYHGFKPVQSGKERWVITSSFCGVNYKKTS